jgi:hypothetical protein
MNAYRKLMNVCRKSMNIWERRLNDKYTKKTTNANDRFPIKSLLKIKVFSLRSPTLLVNFLARLPYSYKLSDNNLDVNKYSKTHKYIYIYIYMQSYAFGIQIWG